MHTSFRSRRLVLGLLAAGTLALSACANGHLNCFGYSTEPNYDTGIRTVYVPIPQNLTYRRGLEFDLKRALDREINSKTPYVAVSSRDQADTELLVKIVNRGKHIIILNQLSEVRDADTLLNAEVTWVDLRPGHTGEVLSKPEGPQAPAKEKLSGAEDPLAPPPKPLPVPINSHGTFIPELGGSIASAERLLIDRMAVHVISMMEKPW